MEWNGCPASDDSLNRIKSLGTDSTCAVWMDILKDIGLKNKQYIVNSPDGNNGFPSAKWTLLHHAAYLGAPLAVFEEMSRRRFPVSLPDADGRLAVNVLRSGIVDRDEICDILAPKYKLLVDPVKLKKIQDNFHAVILSRASNLVKEHSLALPVLSMLLEKQYSEFDVTVYFAIPGMYGGFSFELELTNDDKDVHCLVTDSWCRVVGGSGQRHKCTADKWELIDEGFV